MSKFANRSPFGTSQRIAYGISSGRTSPSGRGANCRSGLELGGSSGTHAVLNIFEHSKQDAGKGLGFTTAVERLDVLGEGELREALLYVRGSSDPVTADDAAAVLEVHRSVARGRLERLARAGLLETSFRRSSGRTGPGAGRPAKF